MALPPPIWENSYFGPHVDIPQRLLPRLDTSVIEGDRLEWYLVLVYLLPVPGNGTL